MNLDSWQLTMAVINILLQRCAAELQQRGKKIKWQERNRPRAIVYSESAFEVGGHFLSRLPNEHFVCVLPLCKSLSASKSYVLPLHNNGGVMAVCKHDKDTEHDNVFLSGGVDSWSRIFCKVDTRQQLTKQWRVATFTLLMSAKASPIKGRSEHTSGLWRSVIWPCRLIVSQRMSPRPVRSFSAAPQPTKRHTNTTRFWRQEGIYAPPLNIPSVCPGPSCLVGLKARRAGSRRSRPPPPPPSFTPKVLQDITVRLKVNNVPTAYVHIRCGSAAFPQPLAIFRSGKGVSNMRAGGLLCAAMIHVRLHEQFDS